MFGNVCKIIIIATFVTAVVAIVITAIVCLVDFSNNRRR